MKNKIENRECCSCRNGKTDPSLVTGHIYDCACPCHQEKPKECCGDCSPRDYKPSFLERITQDIKPLACEICSCHKPMPQEPPTKECLGNHPDCSNGGCFCGTEKCCNSKFVFMNHKPPTKECGRPYECRPYHTCIPPKKQDGWVERFDEQFPYSVEGIEYTQTHHDKIPVEKMTYRYGWPSALRENLKSFIRQLLKDQREGFIEKLKHIPMYHYHSKELPGTNFMAYDVNDVLELINEKIKK